MIQIEGKIPYIKIFGQEWLKYVRDTLKRYLHLGLVAWLEAVDPKVPLYTGALRHSLDVGIAAPLGEHIDWHPPSSTAKFWMSPEDITAKIQHYAEHSWLEDISSTNVIATRVESAVDYYPTEEYTKGMSPRSPWRSFFEGKLVFRAVVKTIRIKPPTLKPVFVTVD